MADSIERWKDHLDYAERARIERRTSIVAILLLGGFVAYGAGLWYHQVLKGKEYQTLASGNFLRRAEVAAHRGNILDRHGWVLVRNRLSFNVLLHRQQMQDTERVFGFLAPLLELDEKTLAERVEAARPRPSHEPVILAEDVTLSQAVSIEARRLEWPELSIDVTARRSYPESRVAAHVLGYVGEISLAEMRSGTFQEDLRPGDIVGKTGIERVYESDLQGVKGFKRVMVNSRGRVMEEVGIDRTPVHGRDVLLTLDLTLQRKLEEGLASHVGSGVFIDPMTGEIMAMVSSPAFEPNLFARRFPQGGWDDLISDPLKPLQDRTSLSRYSPGSVFKLVIAAAGLEEGLITAATRISCAGSGVFYGRRFRCHKEEGHGTLDLEEAVVYSCNVFFYTVGQKLGIDRIAAYARRLGLGETTGVDLVAEDEGLVPSPEWKRQARGEPWYGGETISVSIGGGPIGVTPLQMARLAATLANGGKQVQPHLRFRGEPAEARERARIANETGFSTATLAALRRAMAGVVNRGTGKATRLPGIQVAAKTGTAQYSARSAGVDADDLPYAIRDHAWLVGFAPANSPEIAFAIFIEHGGHGGTTAAPVARRVLETFFGLETDTAPASAPPQRQAHNEVPRAAAP